MTISEAQISMMGAIELTGLTACPPFKDNARSSRTVALLWPFDNR